ncbi:MAG: zinc-ribbon domain-containing protein [Anaerolineales bacterium]|nr:zinc-ribbon domain-containing protein [Anaerolineales bacterium]
MIIVGMKGREKEIGSGTFYCPVCEASRRYTRYEVGRYFTLFFIPLFRISRMGEHIRCGICGRRFNPEVLAAEPPSRLDRLLASVRADLDSGTPLEMAATKLVNQGIDETEARAAVANAAGGGLMRCEACNFTYTAAGARCARCGGPLVHRTA